MRQALLLILLSLACTGGRGANAGSASSSASGACWPVVPLRFEVLEHGTEWEPIVMLAADGSVTHVKKSAPFAHIANDRVALKGGELSCDAQRVVHVAGTAGTGHYDAEDALIMDPIRVVVRDDGRLEMTEGPKKGDFHARITGDYKNAKRTGALLMLLALAGPP